MPGRPSWKRLLAATAAIAAAGGSKSVIVAPHFEGWVNVAKRNSMAAIEFESPDDAVKFIRNNGHFRTKIFADYYVTDSSSWLVKFCHDDDWHAFLPEAIACSLQVKRAFYALRFSCMPPWPPAAMYE
jgi:hypothetical protein